MRKLAGDYFLVAPFFPFYLFLRLLFFGNKGPYNELLDSFFRSKESLSLKLGIVGLPNAGKSTLFNALTGANAAVAEFPFTTIEPNIALVAVPDERLLKLGQIFHPEELTAAKVEFVDIAGLVKGASKGEGLGNRFLAYIREVDVLVEVVRSFINSRISHVTGEIDPALDIEILELELALADLETVVKRITKLEKDVRKDDVQYQKELEFLKKIYAYLERGEPLRNLSIDYEGKLILSDCHLLTVKPVVYVVNVDEKAESQGDPGVQTVSSLAQARGGKVVVLCAKLEEELSRLPQEEANFYRMEYGWKESGRDKLVKTGYELLNLITFYTVVGKEVKAWGIPKGTKAPQAAGEVHSDMEKGFIRVEVLAYQDLITWGSLPMVREKGDLRIEGREYEVKDGDILYFRFQP